MTIRETCLQRAEQSRLMASGMYCRSNAEAKAAALKAAAVYKMVAGWAESMEGAALADRCMAAADDYLRSAKPYAKRAVSTERAAYVKGAAVLREIAEMARKPEPRQRRASRDTFGRSPTSGCRVLLDPAVDALNQPDADTSAPSTTRTFHRMLDEPAQLESDFQGADDPE
jgi:hypothetical protein